MATNNQDLETTVALVKKDLDNFSQLFNKLDLTVGKMIDISNDVSKLLSLHEQRLENLYQNDKLLESKLEKNTVDLSEEMKELHHHIRNNNRDVMEKLKSSEDSIKNDIKYIRDSIDRENKNLKDSIDTTNENQKTLTKRLDALERWRWVVGGAIMTGVWVLNRSGISFTIFS